MKSTTTLWVLNWLLLIGFLGMTLFNVNYCTLSGFTLYSKTDWLPGLVSFCNNTSIITYLITAIIVVNCLLIIYLTHLRKTR